MKMSVFEMRSKRAALLDQAKAFLDEHTVDGHLSVEDAATYDKMVKEIEQIGNDIDRFDQLERMDAELAAPTSTPVRINPRTGGFNPKRADDVYAEEFLNGMRNRFRTISNVLSEGVDASGGYLVPAEWDRRLIEKLEEENVFRKLGTVIQTSGEHKINIASSKPAAAWTEENAELSFGDATFDQVILDAWKLSVAIKVSEELLADNAFDLRNFIIRSFGEAIAKKEEESFILGDGNKKPTGILHAEKGGQVGVVTKGDAITADDLIDIVYALKRPYRTKAAFLMADSTLAAVRKLRNEDGTLLWQPAFTAGEPDRILGFPVYTSQFMPTIAAGKPVVAFGDFSYYNIGDRGHRTLAVLNELFAVNGQTAFVSKMRVDGRLVLPEAVQILKMKEAAAG